MQESIFGDDQEVLMMDPNSPITDAKVDGLFCRNRLESFRGRCAINCTWWMSIGSIDKALWIDPMDMRNGQKLNAHISSAVEVEVCF